MSADLVRFPRVALGTSPASYHRQFSSGGEHAFFKDLTLRWLRAGGTHLDTAHEYGSLRAVGSGLAEAIARGVTTRGATFVTAKISVDVLGGNTSAVRSLLLEPLGLDSVDMLLLHGPGFSAAARLASWRACVEAQRRGYARHIGASNFAEEHYDELRPHYPLPSLNQVEWHLGKHDEALYDASVRAGVALQGTSVLGYRWTSEPGVLTLARAGNLTVAALIYKWVRARLGSAVVATADDARLREALDAFAGPEVAPATARYLNSYAATVQPVESEAKAAAAPFRLAPSTEAYDPSKPQPLVRSNVIASDELYATLSAEYPMPFANNSVFPRRVWEAWARSHPKDSMGRASGALMVWWDSPLMAILLEHSAAWRAFDAYVNSPAFLRGVIDTFGPQLLQNNPELRHASTLADPASCRHAWHAEMENREQDYYRRDRCSPFNRTADVDPRELHTIWSFQAQPCPSVGKGPHRDRENRIFSMVLFFSDADAAGWAGGEFVMLSGTDAARKRGTPFLTHRPKPNHAVLFLNRQRSIHRVNDVTGCPSTYARPEDKWRRVVYLSVARRVASWEHVSKAPGHTDWPPQSTCSYK